MKITIEGSSEEIREYYELLEKKVPDIMRAQLLSKEGSKELHLEVKAETTFKDGDTVRALADGQFGDISAGDIGVVSDCDMGSIFSIRVVSKNKFVDYFRPQDLELVEHESYKPSEGDIVVITANTNNSRNKVGDIGRVGRIMGDIARVDVPNRPSKAGEYGNWTLFSEMRPATEEEKAQYEQAVKWAKFGRQPNEFKKGDIARVMDDDDYPELIGKFVEVYGENEGSAGGGNVYVTEDRKIILGENLELVAPVEARVDR